MKRKRRIFYPLAAALLGLGVVAGAAAFQSTSYRFDEVYSKVTVDTDSGSTKAETGTVAHGGDMVRTGWRGRATISAESVASRFEIYPGSRVRLASEKPGVIVVLERGRLKAMFDAVTGDDERIVETPGALLAVRGTRYGVEVDSTGDAVLSVFEGMVEVRPFDSNLEPLLVRPGEVGRFGPKEAPRTVMHGVSEKTWNDRGGVREMPGVMGSPDSKRGDSPTPGGRDPGGMMGGTTGPSTPSGSGNRKPH